jgi:transposase
VVKTVNHGETTMAEKKRERRKYTKEFKSEAVRLLADERYSTAEVAEKLGVKAEQLYRWRREQEKDGEEAFRGNGKRTALEQKVWELEREVRDLRSERDFLKKTAAYFAKEK